MSDQPTLYRKARSDEIGQIREVVELEPDIQYLLDWAVDVGGDNYRPDRQEVEEVLSRVLGIGDNDDD